jgi:signal transduction histidine kinase
MSRLALAGCAVVAAVSLAAQWYAPPIREDLWVVLWQLVAGAGLAAAGAMVVTARSVPGWLLVAAGALILAAPTLRAAGAPVAADALSFAALLGPIPLALTRIVEARPSPPLMRLFDAAVLASAVVGTVAVLTHADAIAGAAATAGGTAVLCAIWLLFESTTGDDRRRVLWVILGCVVSTPTTALLLVVFDNTTRAELAIAITISVVSLGLPFTTAVALLAPRLVDVREVIHRIVVFLVMFALAGALYVGGETAIEALTGAVPGRGVRVGMALAVAAAFHPLMRWIRSSVDEMLFGGRADPVDTLSRLGTQFADGSSPAEWLDTLRVALAVPGVVLRAGDEVVASSGTVSGVATSVTQLRADGEHVGDLVVALPPEQVRLPANTAAVVALVAAPLAQTLHATRLAEALRISRSLVVTALEEERRRTRRDLHDGLGPVLTGMVYSADAAANLLRTDPAAVPATAEILRQLRADAAEAITEIRRIVYGLRPKALDELGLVGAVRQQLAHLRAADGQSLAVTISAPADLPELPAAVEVAAYRVAVEAVTNVARHAGVPAASVDFALDEGTALRVTVRDGGQRTGDWQAGVGLRSMRERVEQIGGTLSIRTGDGGSTVTAGIPLQVPG